MPTPKLAEKAIEETAQRWNDGLHKLTMPEAAKKLGLDRYALRRRLAAAKRMEIGRAHV